MKPKEYIISEHINKEVSAEEFKKYHQDRIPWRLEEIAKIEKSASKRIAKLNKEIEAIKLLIEGI